MSEVVQRGKGLGFAACALASALWGCGFFFGKIALAEMGVGAMVLYRFLFAALGLVPLLLMERPRLSRREWGALLGASFLGVPLQFLLQFKGLSLTTVSHASLMVGTMPVIIALGAVLFAQERLHTVGWAALAVSTCGAALIAFGAGPARRGSQGPTLAGDVLVVASLIIALFWILINQHLVKRHKPAVVTAYGLLAGTLMLLLYVPVAYGLPPVHGVSGKAWAALAASGVLCTASTTLLWNWGLTQVPASQAGVLLNIEPLIGSLLGVLLLQERLGPTAYVGGSLILTAALTLTLHAPVTSVSEEVVAA